jgi:hypothetical protein
MPERTPPPSNTTPSLGAFNWNGGWVGVINEGFQVKLGYTNNGYRAVQTSSAVYRIPDGAQSRAEIVAWLKEAYRSGAISGVYDLNQTSGSSFSPTGGEVRKLWQIYKGSFEVLQRYNESPGYGTRQVSDALTRVRRALEPYARGFTEEPGQVQDAIKALGDLQRQLNRALKLPGSQDSTWLSSVGGQLEKKEAGQPYELGVNDCSIFISSLLKSRFLVKESDLDRIMIRDTPPYDELIRTDDERALGPVGWLVKEEGWQRTTLEQLTPRELREGAVAQITWAKGGGHSVLITDVVRDSRGNVTGFQALSAHSLPNPKTGQTGIYSAFIPLSEVRAGSKGVAVAVEVRNEGGR